MQAFFKYLTKKLYGLNSIQSNAFHSSSYWGESNDLNGTENTNVTIERVEPVIPILEFNDITDPLVIESIKKSLKLKAGAYAFKNTDTGEIVYVGSSSNLARRAMDHITGRSSNKILQQAFQKYGISAFIFILLEEYLYDWDLSTQENLDLLFALEQKYLDSLSPRYNIAKVAGASMAGRNHSEETKAKMSGENNPNYGKDFSGENNPFSGMTHSEETKSRISSTKSTAVSLYSLDNELINVFTNQSQAAKFLGVGQPYISRLIKSGRIFKGKFLLKGPDGIC